MASFAAAGAGPARVICACELLERWPTSEWFGTRFSRTQHVIAELPDRGDELYVFLDCRSECIGFDGGGAVHVVAHVSDHVQGGQDLGTYCLLRRDDWSRVTGWWRRRVLYPVAQARPERNTIDYGDVTPV